MKTKIKKIIAQVKHICSNANYKIRYNNLVKKYDELEKEYEKLEKKLSAEYINTQLKEAQKQAIMYKKQRDQVRQDYISLENFIKSKES
jgi:hypothetical protein